MKLTFLGTAAGIPSPSRNVQALALQLDQRREWWLFDCGEGTQQQAMRAGLSLGQIRRIFISHLHGDHCFGLPGLMATRGFRGGEGPLDLYGPPGLSELIEANRRITRTHFAYPYTVHESGGAGQSALGVIAEDDEYLVHAVQVPHVGTTLAFVIEEKQRQGRFKIDEAQALGIPPGPVYARLKNGESVALPDGRVIDGKTLVEPPRKGRKLVIVCDTSDASAILPLAQNADLMVHEATYLQADIADNESYGHSSAAGAAKCAKAANAGRLVLNHISHRYEQGDPALPKIKELVAEAESHFFKGRVLASYDFMTVEVPTAPAG